MHQSKKYCFCTFTENSKTPYSATVMINDMEYGSGCAISKKLAKSEAGMLTVGFKQMFIFNDIK